MEQCLQCGLGWPPCGPKTPRGGLGPRQPAGRLPARSQGHEGVAGEVGSRQLGTSGGHLGGSPTGQAGAGWAARRGALSVCWAWLPGSRRACSGRFPSLGVLSLKEEETVAVDQPQGHVRVWGQNSESGSHLDLATSTRRAGPGPAAALLGPLSHTWGGRELELATPRALVLAWPTSLLPACTKPGRAPPVPGAHPPFRDQWCLTSSLRVPP